MKKTIAAAVAALSICTMSGANAAPGFRMIVKGRPQVNLERMSYDQTIVYALDEFIAYMNAALKTTDYNGREGIFTLTSRFDDGVCSDIEGTDTPSSSKLTFPPKRSTFRPLFFSSSEISLISALTLPLS